MIRWWFGRINIWVILVSLLVAGLLILVVGLVVFFSPVPQQQASPQAFFTLIPAPSDTPTLQFTPTAQATEPVVVGGISIGSYVQIAGTEGQGLRIRSGPGTNNPARFVGMDAEVFMVKDGPKDSDGFTWWYLEAPYDPQRSGWAAANYLQVIKPTATP
jgi:hypothetical protein